MSVWKRLWMPFLGDAPVESNDNLRKRKDDGGLEEGVSCERDDPNDPFVRFNVKVVDDFAIL